MGSGDFPNLEIPGVTCLSDSQDPSFSSWWFQIFFIFTPIWGRFPFWLIFFKGVETTNKFCLYGDRFWSCVNISQLFVVANMRGTNKKNRRFHKTPDNGRGFCFFLGEKQKERYFWHKTDIGFSISQERKRLEQVVDNPQNRLTQLNTGEKTRWSTRLCFLLILFLMTICTANIGYVYILAKHLIQRKIRWFCFIYHVFKNIYKYIHIYIAWYICIWLYILYICIYIIWISFSY